MDTRAGLEARANSRLEWSSISQVLDLPGALAYGINPEDSLAKAETLALRVIADRLEHTERTPTLNNFFVAA